METAESLRRQTATANELHTVVQAMKALSSVSILPYERAVAALGHYLHTIELGFKFLLRDGLDRLPEPRISEADPFGLVILGSDHSLCGPFNRDVADHALAWLGNRGPGGVGPRVACHGMTLVSELESRGVALDAVARMPGSVDTVADRVHGLLITLEAWRLEHGIERVMLFHNRPTQDRRYTSTTVRLAPLDVAHLRRLAEHPWPTHVLPMTRLEGAALAAALTREYTFITLYRAFIDSLASEHAARLTAMQGAERTIEERLTQLALRYHEVRQAAITEELLDVTAGFEALGGAARPRTPAAR